MKKNKSKKTKTKEEKQEPLGTTPVPDKENNKPFDFGGIPNRDLKKNLGCG